MSVTKQEMLDLAKDLERIADKHLGITSDIKAARKSAAIFRRLAAQADASLSSTMLNYSQEQPGNEPPSNVMVTIDTTSVPPGEQAREKIAQIIDPVAFRLDGFGSYAEPDHLPSRAEAFMKARAILALSEVKQPNGCPHGMSNRSLCSTCNGY